MILRPGQQRERRNPRLMVVWDEGQEPEDVTAVVRGAGEQFIFYTASQTFVADDDARERGPAITRDLYTRAYRIRLSDGRRVLVSEEKLEDIAEVRT